MKGAESFHDIEKFSGSRFENCQLGKQTEGKMVRLEAEAYDMPLKPNGGEKYSFFNEPEQKAEMNEYRKEKLTEIEKWQLLVQEIYYPDREYDFPEFNFDAEGLNRALESFTRPDWGELSVEEKKLIISSYREELALGLDISKRPKIAIRQMPETNYGDYREKMNIIDINSSLLDRPEDLAYTIAHEMRHVYQYERAKKGETHLDKLYGLNLNPEFYIRPVKDETGKWSNVNEYEKQLVEAEANAFAEKITGMMEGMK